MLWCLYAMLSPLLSLGTAGPIACPIGAHAGQVTHVTEAGEGPSSPIPVILLESFPFPLFS